MDDCPVPTSNYALQLALQTMKERCVQLQKRVSTLQEENLALKTNPSTNPTNIREAVTLNSLETAIAAVSKLTEERNQLKKTITMVAAENKQLWSNLSRLTQENKSYSTKTSRTNDKLSASNEKVHMPLIRSRTFTQEAPHTKHLQKVLSETDKVSLELEDISLKLQNSFTKEKNIDEEILDINEEVQEIHNSSSEESFLGKDSLGFNYLEDDEEFNVDDSLSDSIEQHLVDLKHIKLMLKHHNEVLKMSVDKLVGHKLDLQDQQHNNEIAKRKSVHESKMIQVNIEAEEKQQKEKELNNLEPLEIGVDWSTPESSIKLDKNMDRICPMCEKHFHVDVEFEMFSRHVQEHFMDYDVLRI